MGFAAVHSRAVWGLEAPRVTVEVHLANGLPSFGLVGLAETEVREARERVRSAILNSGLAFPSNQRITVNLAPADLPKESGRFDLPIAVGILAASGALPPEALAGYEFAGELSLSGELRPVRGALAMAQALHQEGSSTAMVLPAGSAQEAALVPGTRVYSVKQLQDILQALAPATQAAPAWQPLQVQTQLPQECTLATGDLQDVKGHAGVKRALEVAAAGGHSLLLVGPPGAGKSMLAQRLAPLLPPLRLAQALQTAAIHSIYGPVGLAQWGQRAYRHPHHSASLAALVGGGVPPRPGEISLAHHGVLFLDEFPEFSRAALEALREPLETGIINLSRARHHVTYPAEFQLVAAMNPCPCGYLGMQKPSCRCSPLQVARYQGRISGPLWDRIDMQVSVNALSPDVLINAPPGERTSVVKARCVAAHERAWARQGCRNKDLAQAQLQALVLSPEASSLLANAAEQRAWSARATHRVLRLAQTIADLAQADEIGHMHMAEALQYRSFLA